MHSVRLFSGYFRVSRILSTSPRFSRIMWEFFLDSFASSQIIACYVSYFFGFFSQSLGFYRICVFPEPVRFSRIIFDLFWILLYSLRFYRIFSEPKRILIILSESLWFCRMLSDLFSTWSDSVICCRFLSDCFRIF